MCFPLLTQGNDYRCYYSRRQMLFVLRRPSPEHCLSLKMKERQQEREKYTVRQTAWYHWWKYSTWTFSLSNEHPRQTETETAPCLSLLIWELYCWGRGIAKSYVNILHSQHLHTASTSQTDLDKVHERHARKNWRGLSRRESRRANDIGRTRTNYTVGAWSSLAFKLRAFTDWVRTQVSPICEVHGNKADGDQSAKLDTSQNQLSL